MMLSAIAGSTIARRRREDVQRRQRQRDAVRDRERGHDRNQLADRPAEQQQADEEQQVIGADQDVMDARRHEPLARRRSVPCRVPAKYSNRVRDLSRIACEVERVRSRRR